MREPEAIRDLCTRARVTATIALTEIEHFTHDFDSTREAKCYVIEIFRAAAYAGAPKLLGYRIRNPWRIE